jgi:inosine-uridine nucleoside N-ribohydrolase
MSIDRRQAIAALSLTALTSISLPSTKALARPGQTPFAPQAGPRARVMFVNDLSGDVDGLFAAIHALLSPSIDLRGIIGTGTGNRTETAEDSAVLAQEMLRLTGRDGKVPVHIGAPRKLATDKAPDRSPGTQAIIDEAMRADSALPLYFAVGGGLTEVASAIMLEPSIADRFTLVWIGGTLAKDAAEREYNFAIDPLAAQYVFNETTVPLWQVPREAYATCLVSASELQVNVGSSGRTGQWLYEKLLAANAKMAGFRMNTGETWILGDSSLMVLTALTDWVPSQFGPRPKYERTSSSAFNEVQAPILDRNGNPQPRQDGRKIRVYKTIDVRMMLADFYAKLRLASEK